MIRGAVKLTGAIAPKTGSLLSNSPKKKIKSGVGAAKR